MDLHILLPALTSSLTTLAGLVLAAVITTVLLALKRRLPALVARANTALDLHLSTQQQAAVTATAEGLVLAAQKTVAQSGARHSQVAAALHARFPALATEEIDAVIEATVARLTLTHPTWSALPPVAPETPAEPATDTRVPVPAIDPVALLAEAHAKATAAIEAAFAEIRDASPVPGTEDASPAVVPAETTGLSVPSTPADPVPPTIVTPSPQPPVAP